MDTRCMLLFIFILILLYILHNTNKETYINIKIPNNILKYFTKTEFLKNTGDFKITYVKYKNNSIYSNSYIDSTVSDFLKKTENTSNNRYQIKQIFNKNELTKYILKNAYKPLIKVLGLNENNIKSGFIRVSKEKWTFDYHYDCLNLLLFQLYGTRIIYTKKNKNSKEVKHILKPGDILYIPMGEYHKVKTNSELNINFNIILNEHNINKILKCKKQFGHDFKIQDKKCKTNNCI